MKDSSPSQPPVGETSRREFIRRSSALAVGGAALSTGLGIAQSAHVVGDDDIKVALIGCGARGSQAAVQALRTQGKVTLWAMADAFAKRIEQSLGKIRRELEQAAGTDSPGTLWARARFWL